MSGLEKRKKTMIGTAAITVMAVVFSQFFYYEAASFPKAEVNKEKQASQKIQNDQTDLPDTPSDHQTYVSLQSTTLPSSTEVVVHQVMVFLFEIQFEERESPSADFRIFLPPNRFFKTLFDSVISPNAP